MLVLPDKGCPIKSELKQMYSSNRENKAVNIKGIPGMIFSCNNKWPEIKTALNLNNFLGEESEIQNWIENA